MMAVFRWCAATAVVAVIALGAPRHAYAQG